MDDERTPVKAKQLVVDCSKRGRPKKRWKDLIVKNMLARGLKRSSAQDRAVWRVGCENSHTPACQENKPGSRKMKLIVNTPGING